MIESNILPDWVFEPMPKNYRPLATIYYSHDDSLFKAAGATSSSDKIEDLYSELKNKNYDVFISDNIPKRFGSFLVQGLFLCPEDDKGSSQALFSTSSREAVQSLEEDLTDFVTIKHPEYEENSHDWVLAHNWLSYHPAFWRHSFDFHWDIDDGLRDLDVNVFYDSDLQPCCALELGEHLPPEYKSRYYDPRLDASGRTFEEAIVKLAKNVNKYFTPMGVERE